MVSGIVAALLCPILLPNILPIYAFPFIIIVSAIGSIVGSLLTKVDMEVLKSFYSNVRPWGFWKPVYEKVLAENPQYDKNMNFKRDMLNVSVGIVWQTTLTVLPLYLVIKEWIPLVVAIILTSATSYFLKINWLDKLDKN